MECIGIRTESIVVSNGEGLIQIFNLIKSHLEKYNEKLEAGDVIVVSGKLCSVAEGLIYRSSDIIASEPAKVIAARAKMSEGFVQQVIDDSDEIIGVLPHVITTIRKGVMIANAGVDQSNVDPKLGDLIALPRNPDETALKLMKMLRDYYHVPIGVVIADSVVHTLRRGTSGCALGVAGFHAVTSELGKKDLFGREMRVTKCAVADNVCSAALLLMGETDERVPIVVVRGSRAEILTDIEAEKATTYEAVVPKSECIYIGNALSLNPKSQEYLQSVFSDSSSDKSSA